VKQTPLPTDPPRFAELEEEYELVRELGRGGTAVVYLARERELERHVAIKVIRATYVEDEEAAARLLREARTVGGLQHPNIVMLYGTRRLRDGSLALVMQYVPGHTLKSEIRRRGPLPVDEALRILGDVARALAYAHHRRIVHRDIKPENIYIDDETGVARLSDFGIARPWDADSNLTLPGSAIGTPTYMSPEQIDGGWTDGRSDIYSLGLVGWEMLTGRSPWSGETLFSTIFKQKHEDLPSLAQLRPDVSAGLAAVLERALSKRAEDRWPDAESLLAALGLPAQARGRVPAAAPGLDAFADPEDAPAPDNPTIAWRRPDAGAAAAATGAGGHTATWPEAQDSRPRTDSAAQATDATESKAAAAAPVAGQPVGPAGDESQVWRPDPARRDAPRRRWPLVLAAIALVLAAGSAAALFGGLDGFGDRLGLGSETAEEAGEVTPQPVLTEPLRGEPGFGPEPGLPAVMYPLAGAEQQGAAGDTLREMVVVRVEDRDGRPAPNATVRFTVTAGDGVVSPVEAQTDAHGLAMARWVVRSEGDHSLEAAVADGGVTPATFRAVARSAAVAQAGRRDVGTAAEGPDGVASSAAAGAEPATDRGRQPPGAAAAPAAPAAPAAGAARPGATGGASVVSVRSGVVAGGLHSCLLDGSGGLTCWGGNASGQLGDGSGGRSAKPVRVSALEPLARVAAGVSHSCAVATTGSAWCWGANTAGQLGDGTRAQRNEPVRVRTDVRLTAVAAGARHSCAITAAGAALCWGDNAAGQLGSGSRDPQIEPGPVSGGHRFGSLAAGWEHTCGLGTDGRAFCWGRNSSGELGDGTTTDRIQPVAAAPDQRFSALAAGNGFTCGLRTDGVVLCWGQNANGQLGRGTTRSSAEPLPVAGDQTFTTLAAGGVHACGLSRDGTVFCWGRNNYGQVGDGTFEDRTSPAAVAGGRRLTNLSAVGSHTCGAAAGGGAFCWGYNLEGQLGNGSRTNSSRPVAVSRP
jgi:alpha-tubulin suppressor-like RCC1 family protein/serine/threonine protein kinase